MRTWLAAIAAYDRHLAAGGRAATTRRLRRTHLYALADHVDAAPLRVTLSHLESWLWCAAWSANTRRSAQSSVRGFFAWLHETGQRADNPAAQLIAVRAVPGVPRPTPDDIVRAALARAEPPVRLMIELAACAGLRRAEVAAVHAEHVEDTISGPVLRVVGKGGRARLVPIGGELADRIRSASGWVFPSPYGGHLVGDTVGAKVGAVLPAGWTTHTLRHRFASTAYSVDRDLRAVQELLGHASVATTQVYTAVPPEAARRAAAAAALAA